MTWFQNTWNVYVNLTKKTIMPVATNSPCWIVRITRLKTYGDRAFSVAGPEEWNKLPLDLKCSPSHETFKSRLKIYLYQQCFSSVYLLLGCLLLFILIDEHWTVIHIFIFIYLIYSNCYMLYVKSTELEGTLRT